MSYVAPKRSTDLLATKSRSKLHHNWSWVTPENGKMFRQKYQNMVKLRTNFCSQQISASFWCNIGQKFLECTYEHKYELIRLWCLCLNIEKISKHLSYSFDQYFVCFLYIVVIFSNWSCQLNNLKFQAQLRIAKMHGY